MSRREHAVDAGKRIEAREPDLRLAGQALHGIVDVAELDILREKQPVASERSADREPRLEPAQAAEAFAQPRHEVARLDLPVVGAAPGANLHEARRKPAVLGRERIGEQLDRLETLAGQFEIEVTGRGIDEAGAADLERALRGLPALGAEPSVGTAQDAGQQRQQALEVVAFQRRDVEDRSRRACRWSRPAARSVSAMSAPAPRRRARRRSTGGRPAPAPSHRLARRRAPTRWKRIPGASPARRSGQAARRETSPAGAIADRSLRAPRCRRASAIPRRRRPCAPSPRGR